MSVSLNDFVRNMAKAVGSDPDTPARTQEPSRMQDRPTNPNGYAVMRKAGGLRNGNEYSNSLWHAVRDGEGAALCGTRPSVGWRSDDGTAKTTVTCERCQETLNDWPEAELDGDAAPSAAF
ncbi:MULTISPECIES: hypothetical protein [unclassified Pannonibacter]|uniref:hypothetical protein n=1 Tax=unclassified Pannonibacter TaxID=2627228 RepID=UPI0016470188|nr:MULTISPECIES: hypothetical protein [unclassified Pannonibacter]